MNKFLFFSLVLISSWASAGGVESYYLSSNPNSGKSLHGKQCVLSNGYGEPFPLAVKTQAVVKDMFGHEGCFLGLKARDFYKRYDRCYTTGITITQSSNVSASCDFKIGKGVKQDPNSDMRTAEPTWISISAEATPSSTTQCRITCERK